jgi:2-keto-4-pentenoate hydratase/2-oxohepta-3-ene-1,7-dioic acid hydratase in catechol pathway
MIFPVPEIIARLSNVIPLLPGDVIFTGTPAGVGVGRTPQRFIRPGDEVETSISGIGSIQQRFVNAQ